MIEPRRLNDEVKEFIVAHAQADVPSLVLKHKSVAGLPISQIADQIIGRRKANIKLPTYFGNADVLYPPALNLEQTSSETTAEYKASMLASLTEHENLVDLTAGFGIDTLAFSKYYKRIIHVEPNSELQQLAQFNHELLGADNISYVNETAEAYLGNSTRTADLEITEVNRVDTLQNNPSATEGPWVSAVYIDPSRRNASRKVFSFHDCLPDITTLQHDILKRTPVLLVKASPMHDVQLALSEIRHVQRVIVLAVDNEVRELLFVSVMNFDGEPTISSVNISSSGTVAVEFSYAEEKATEASYADVMSFLYEPNAALLKAGAFKLMSKRFGVHKLHINTHLYTSDHLVANFPGRIFRVASHLKADPRSLSVHFPEGKSNIIVRNYPSTPEALKKKLRLSDGGERYVLAFTSSAGPTLVAATRIN